MYSLSLAELPRCERELTPGMVACLRSYQQVLEERELLYAQVREDFPEKIQCSPLCNECCTQIFFTRMMDLFLVRRGFVKLSEEVQSELFKRAERWLKEGGVPSHVWVGKQKDIPTLGEVEEQLPIGTLLCPLVEWGIGCQLYPYRTVVCRSYGYPQLQPNGTMANTCYKNLQGIASEQLHSYSVPARTLIAVEQCKQEFFELLGISDSTNFAVALGLVLPLLLDPITIDWVTLFKRLG